MSESEDTPRLVAKSKIWYHVTTLARHTDFQNKSNDDHAFVLQLPNNHIIPCATLLNTAPKMPTLTLITTLHEQDTLIKLWNFTFSSLG